MITKIKTFHPKSTDTKYMGTEPVFESQPEPADRRCSVMGAFTWYNYYCDKKMAKQFVLEWLHEKSKKDIATKFSKVPESVLSNQMGWLCRMELRGLELDDRETGFIQSELERALATKIVTKETETETKPAAPRPNIQDHLREKMLQASGELEGLYDDMITDGCKPSANRKPMAVLRGMNISPQLIPDILAHWQQRQAELQQVLEGRDAELVEGYGNFGKIQVRNLHKFCDQVLADCNSYVQIKKVERKPRAKKAKPPEIIAKSFKTLAKFEELNLAGEPAARLVNATEAWLYDTKKRKLIHLVADQHIGSFTVKGSSVIAFDAGSTLQKTLRKPAEQLKSLLSANTANARKFFRDIKATETRWNGRGNENLVILRVR